MENLLFEIQAAQAVQVEVRSPVQEERVSKEKKTLESFSKKKKKQLPHLPVKIQVVQVEARVQIKEESVPKEKKAKWNISNVLKTKEQEKQLTFLNLSHPSRPSQEESVPKEKKAKWNVSDVPKTKEQDKKMKKSGTYL